jgi:hypothetical protein
MKPIAASGRCFRTYLMEKIPLLGKAEGSLLPKGERIKVRVNRYSGAAPS